MTLLRLLFVAAALALLAAIGRAIALQPDFLGAFAKVAADLWGGIGLLDLYLGFAVTTVLIALTEGRRFVTVAWLVALFFLGNVVTALWLAYRLPRLATVLRTVRQVSL